jgi:hypothetical protein
VQQHKWQIRVDARVAQQIERRTARWAGDRNREPVIACGKPERLDQAQIALNLVDGIRRAGKRGGQAGAAELLRLTSAQRDASQVANIASRVRRLGK